MKIYLVGGAVRDQLLGLPVKERDWVVVGATVNDMLKLGYRQVGKEFPVFLHPETKEEYALARLERKIKPGYQGFDFDTSPKVSLEDDLLRRDLTINAMAMDQDSQALIDPYHGRDDLNHRTLRHVSNAFTEDPVRILRVGRFLARYSPLGFQVAPETLALMQQMVTSGEVNALVAERVWKELERALREAHPLKFFEVLADCHALSILFPELSMNDVGMQALQAATSLTPCPAIRFAALLHAAPKTMPAKKAITAFCQRYRLPNYFRELALLTASHHASAFEVQHLSAKTLLTLLGALDVYRRESRFQDFLLACQAIAAVRQLVFHWQQLAEGASVVKSVPVQPLLQAGLTGTPLAQALQEKRLLALQHFLKQTPH